MSSRSFGGRRVAREKVPGLVKTFLSDLGLANIPHHIAGSWIRGLPECDEIDLVLIMDSKQMPEAKKAIKMAFGRHKAKDQSRLSGIYDGVQFDLHLCSIDHLGVTMLHAAGSWQFIKFLRARAKAKGWKLKKSGLFDSLTGEPMLHSVDEVYYLHVLGVQYIEWENRSQGCEFELKSLTDPTRMCKCKLVEDGWQLLNNGAARKGTPIRYETPCPSRH